MKKQNQSAVERFVLHLHPKKIDKRAVKFNRTFGLGGISALLFLILAFTGVILRFSYVPTPEDAYRSIQAITHEALFGRLIRNLHALSANMLIVTSVLHLFRVFYSQSYFGARAKNWLYGLVMLFVVMFSSFTGYLLPWDQLSYWAVTIVTQILEYIPFIGVSIADFVRGGDVVNGNTLLNFYTLHTGILPLLAIFLMSMHFWLVRAAGGIALPKDEQREMVPVVPNLVNFEVMVGLICIAGLFIASILVDAPLLEEANPAVSPNPSKAPWYFLGAQELLLHVHPIFGALVIPMTIIFLMTYLPYFSYRETRPGTWFFSERGKKMTWQSFIFSMIFTFVLILLLDKVFDFYHMFSALPAWISEGLFPFLLYVVPVGGVLYGWKQRGAVWLEITIAFFTIIVTSYITMLLISMFLRGYGMELIF